MQGAGSRPRPPDIRGLIDTSDMKHKRISAYPFTSGKVVTGYSSQGVEFRATFFSNCELATRLCSCWPICGKTGWMQISFSSVRQSVLVLMLGAGNRPGFNVDQHVFLQES